MTGLRSTSDLLVSHGHHFGRTVFALCNYPSLLTNGILRLEQLEDTPLEDLSAEERREHRVFEQLLDLYPGLLEQLKDGSEEEILHVGELIGKGAAGTRGDDTKMLKSAIDHGFNHELTGSLLCPAGLDWNDPRIKENLRSGEMLVYPWWGLLRSRLLVYAYKHVFTSPSSVDREPKAMRSGNAHLHGMNLVTIGSLAYIATQVQFALSSSSVFSQTDTTTDSETFYHSLLDLLEDLEECKEVDELLTWWNRQVFPASSAAKRAITPTLSKIRQ
ncbi:hypothetical protein EDD22DRAFT_982373 [Suillus occidentalis]|nr:hypothetical protein EDD22DRAFT_982373 [Suillus occidentalis]